MSSSDDKKWDLSVGDQKAVNLNLARKFQQAAETNETIQDFLDEFIHQFISEQTQRAYINDLKAFFDFVKSGGVSLSHPREIKSHHFQYYRDDLMEQGRASSTINRKLVSIRSFIKWAMACKMIDHNPLDVVKLPKVQNRSETLAFDDDEVVQMLHSPNVNTISGRMHRMAMVLLFSLGLRRSELTNIRLRDIYIDRNHTVLKIYGKGDKVRKLPLTQDIVDEIEHYLSFMRYNNVSLEVDDYLLQTKESYHSKKSVDGSTIFRVIQRYAKQCGITKKVGAHSCRATAISHLLDTQQRPIRDVAIFAGHSKITTTERYDKRREELDKSVAYHVNYDADKKKSA